MKHLAIPSILLILSSFVWADDHLPPAETLLRGCIGALPDVPLLVTGELQAKSSDGDMEKKIGVEMLLDWHAAPPTARYTTRDAFGKGLEHLSITWPADQPVEFRFFTGEPLQAAPLPDLADPIGGTDISWQDLSLSFLWWPNGQTVGAEEIRGRVCYIVDLPGADATMRLWIDPKIPVMLRAETYRNAELQRRMDVKGFKKINARWVVQNVEIESFPSGHRTVLRVRDVQDRTRKDFIKVDDATADETDNINSDLPQRSQSSTEEPR